MTKAKAKSEVAGSERAIDGPATPEGDAPAAPVAAGPVPEPSYPEALRLAGLTVVEGHLWTERGSYLSDAARIVTEHVDVSDDAAGIDEVKGMGVHALIRRDGSVWLLHQAYPTDKGDQAVRIALVGSEATGAQTDAAAAVVSVLESVAFDAEPPPIG